MNVYGCAGGIRFQSLVCAASEMPWKLVSRSAQSSASDEIGPWRRLELLLWRNRKSHESAGYKAPASYQTADSEVAVDTPPSP